MKKQADPFILLTVILLALVALRAKTFLDEPVRQGEAQVKNRPIEVLENDYVSLKTCETCHPHEHATWHTSFHSTMTQVPPPKLFLARRP
jgi:hypothetical protein